MSSHWNRSKTNCPCYRKSDAGIAKKILPGRKRLDKHRFQRLIEEKKEAAAAGLLQCIGRIKSNALNDIVSGLVSQGLAHSSAQVREAAISVVEQIGDTDLTSLLRSHSDPVPWLNRYAEQVLRDLT